MQFFQQKNCRRLGENGLSTTNLFIILAFLLVPLFQINEAVVLIPPSQNLALGRRIEASHTCGDVNGRPIKEMYCNIAGATQYSPHNQYSYRQVEDNGRYRAFEHKESFLQGGQNCDYCMANTSLAHPASYMVDGSPSWWQSPPLSRGMQYREVNITIDLEQEFFVAYIWIQMANSPRPGTWILEHSADFGKTYKPWQYFASTPAECSRLFGIASLSPVIEDDDVICTTEFSKLDKMENGEIIVNLLENRPGKHNFMSSSKLQNFTRATNVRIRLIRPKTLQGHLMDLHGKDQNIQNDPSVTRRYFYGIKEILMGGRCICNGHADSCDILDASRSRAWLCRCEHNTCGDNCERCCDGFVQKKWQQNNELREFSCEPCNCHGHSDECVFDEEIAANNQSLDIHGEYEGGGRCLNCKDNTEGINCNKCKSGFYRPAGKAWTDADVCQTCVCDPKKHTGNCEEETGKCECLPNFSGPNCDQCAEGYYHPPECRPCECNVNGTLDNTCLPVNGKCPCKEGFGGAYCETCLPEYTNATAGCIGCNCDSTGSQNNICDPKTEQCQCKTNYAGKQCEKCTNGYFNHPACDYCDCDSTGTEDDICDQESGQCLCKPGFAGRRCEQCDENFYGYPNCKECACNPTGSKSLTCLATTGECPCYANFTSRTCDRCAASYYRYPDCLECGCSTVGAKGVTCDNDGQCYCKPNFEGARCDRCMEKFYNYPICEECNCHPSGVIPEFAGCDKVAPGELCTCRENVMGRTCSQCKPTFWDLQAHHVGGCIDCNCNKTGTVSLLNDCDKQTGQCTCKRYVTGMKCDSCADGFYNMESNSHIGCQPCNCDVGGSLGPNCNQLTGQCRCKPRIEGLKCDQPKEEHFFPTPWQFQYEAEDGRLPDGKPVQFAIDTDEFPDFSWRGFVVFSPIQDEIILDVDVKKASVYRLLMHYKNPTKVSVDVEVNMIPYNKQSQDFEQKAKVVLEPNSDPSNRFVNADEKPFVLNPGSWQMRILATKRLFLDYIVLIPSEYYQGSSLNERIQELCKARDSDKSSCVDLMYPPLPVTVKVDASNIDSFRSIDPQGGETTLETIPDDLLPAEIGQAVWIKNSPDQTREIRVDIEVPESNTYYLVIEYFNLESSTHPVRVRVEQGDKTVAESVVVINYCPYASFCRELLTTQGLPAKLELANSPPPARIVFVVPPGREFAIASLNLVKPDVWRNDFLNQMPTCIRKDGKCIGTFYPQPSNSIVTEAESGANQNNSISGDKLPFTIVNPERTQVMSIDSAQSTLDIEGVVASPGDYVFVVHFFNPDNMPTNNDVLVQTERFGDVTFFYCPSNTGCRTVVMDKQNTGQKYFHIDDKYTLTFYHNVSQKRPIYVDSVIAVPRETFTDAALKPLPLDLSTEFSKACSEANFYNSPDKVDPYCKDKIFSLTSDFNADALPCKCNAQGALDFNCEPYGGQCKCKPHVIGRTCSRCAPGFYNYPECTKCQCGPHQQCDERTGQCKCPRYVEGLKCDKCVPYAYGFDRLIGCQLCGCHAEGSNNGELQCDAMNGQCLCKANVGGRQCEKCLPGFYGFPSCYECACEDSGTTDAICDMNTAKCLCKKNVIGETCDTCRAGTFDLRKSDVEGCSECFCFGVTDRCRSSQFPVQTLSFDDQSWKSDDPNGKVEGVQGQIIYTASDDEEQQAKSVYLEAPIIPGKDYTKAYGLHLSFIISSVPSSGKPRRANSASDVRIISGDTVLEYWAPEQPSNLSRPFKVVVSLFPEYWLLKTGEPSSRSQLMLVLLKLEKVLIKASYYENPKKAILEQFELEIGESDSTERSFVTASSVELCECPPPYTGASCQLCAQGYYRVTTSGSLLGSCVPCNCHGHSGTCDPDTGHCSNCQHNTEGLHCERCVEGFYGNATTGSPSSCLRCACPYDSPTNNFATACFVSERGILEKCVCQPGYAGDKCERCDKGFFGEPTQVGGYCEKCFCNHNNDLNEEDACHPITGDCALCEGNTDGRKCEECKEWFYGDAIQAKNCTECQCDKCGSDVCDNKSGTCQCHPLVTGKNCDRCEENAWNFHSCRGCQQCDCGVAASNTQCDLKTGQCACMPGAAGLHCERCEHGFWNYSPQGCKKCDCEADLSLGTVCDVNTGQCHCQEGAHGPRCDSCIENYLKVPKFGCRFCDECVFALNTELDGFDSSVEVLRSTLGNVSSVALTGARLNRLTKAINEIEPQLDRIVTADSEAKQLDELTPNVGTLKDSASSIIIRTERTLEQLNTQIKALDDSFTNLNQLREDANDLIDVSKFVIERVELLKDGLRNTVPVEDREQKIADAERQIAQIHKNENANALEDLKQKVEVASETLNKTQEHQSRLRAHYEQIDKELQRLQILKNSSIDVESELQATKNTIKEVKTILETLSFFTLKASINGIEKDNKEIERNIQQQQEHLKNVTDALEEFKSINETISAQILEIEELKTALSNSPPPARRARRDLDRAQVNAKVADLEAQSRRITGIYDSAKLEAQRAIEAANIYKDVIGIINAAKNNTLNAQIKSAVARKLGRKQKEQAKQNKQRSEMLLKQAEDLDRKTLESLKNQQKDLQNRVDILVPILDEISNNYKSLNLTELDNILERSDKAYADLGPINESISKIKPSIHDTDQRVAQLIGSNVGMTQATEAARNQIELVQKSMPDSKIDWEEAKQRLTNTSSLVEECRSRLTLLKEKIAVARDKANRIKLGAHFERESVLELPIPQPSEDFGSYTDIRIFFRTREENGIILYFGNDNARTTGEFVSLEVESGRPKCTLNIGREPVVVVLNAKVDDYHWREFIVKRVGRQATVKVTKPRSDSAFEDEQTVAVPASKSSVLNIFDDSRRLFVGGVPVGFKIPSSVHQHSFVGDLDKLRLNGELIGFWNSEKAYQISGADMRTLLDAERSAENGVSFNGKGYMQLGVGSWNPRKKTSILLTFMTYSPDGLLFFVGKDKDQLVVELIDGRVRLSFDLGSGLGRLTSNGERYNDGNWHMVNINRIERQAKLEIDSTDIVEGESPGSMFEMSVSDSFYLGGLPRNIEVRFTVSSFRGCIKNLKLDQDYVDLSKAKATKGVQTSCQNKDVRVVSLVSERSFVNFNNLTINKNLELSLRFRTTLLDAHVATVMVSDDEILRISLESGMLVVRGNGASGGGSNGDESELLKTELSTRLSGHWHYVTVQRSSTLLKVQVDDFFINEVATNDISEYLTTEDAMLIFGRSTSNDITQSFVGCIGDSVINEVKLTGCTIGGPQIPSSTSTTAKPENNEKPGENGVPLPEDLPSSESITKAPIPPVHIPNVRAEGACALPQHSHGEREDSRGIRFGLQPGSRLEFDHAPDTMDNTMFFSVHLRATAANGILMFVTNDKHSDFMALYMQEGRIYFSFGSGNAKLTIQSKQSLLDDEWHTVRAEREGVVGALFIDERREAENRTEGTEVIETQAPFYIGGLPSDLSVKSEFGGCLRDFKLNQKSFDDDSARRVGTVECSQITEQGMYFGPDGGYAILSPQFVVGTSFNFELEVKPRTNNAVLLSVGVLEFLTLQLLNGTVKFSVDNGAGMESVIYEPPANNLICDGHWHYIKLYKKKNLITLNVDGKSNLKIMKKKSATETHTKDPLYLGGVPKDIKLRGLATVDPYIGCVRVLDKKSTKRKRQAGQTASTPIDLSEISLYGSVERTACPLN